MATKTGYAQAVVVYRVRASDGAPVGVDGLAISDTGAKQAIALLVGAVNPNPTLYEVQFYYNAEDTIDGEPTVALSDSCPTGVLTLSITRMVFITGGAPQVLVLTSTDNWTVLSNPGGLVTITPANGAEGLTNVSIAQTAALGEADVVFQNTVTGQTAVLHVISAAADTWILQTGIWNDSGFWHADGLWNY